MKRKILFGFGNMLKKTAAPQVVSNAERSYSTTFLKRNKMKKRQCVYISYDVHDIISRLVRRLGNQGQEITIGGYINTVLSEHLQADKEEINEVYRQQQGDLF